MRIMQKLYIFTRFNAVIGSISGRCSNRRNLTICGWIWMRSNIIHRIINSLNIIFVLHYEDTGNENLIDSSHVIYADVWYKMKDRIVQRSRARYREKNSYLIAPLVKKIANDIYRFYGEKLTKIIHVTHY